MIKRIFGKNLEIFEVTTPFETESNNVNNGVWNEVSNLFFCRRTDFGEQVLNNLETSRRLHPLESGLHRARKCSFGLLQVFKWKIKCAFIVNISFSISWNTLHQRSLFQGINYLSSQRQIGNFQKLCLSIKLLSSLTLFLLKECLDNWILEIVSHKLQCGK